MFPSSELTSYLIGWIDFTIAMHIEKKVAMKVPGSHKERAKANTFNSSDLIENINTKLVMYNK